MLFWSNDYSRGLGATCGQSHPRCGQLAPSAAGCVIFRLMDWRSRSGTVHRKYISLPRRIDRNEYYFALLYIVRQITIWSSWSYSHENGPLRSSTSVSSSHHAKMWGVNHAIFGIIRNAMSYSVTRWNMTTFWRANFMLYHFKSKICSFINIYFHQTQSARGNRYHWTLPPLKNIVPYSICFASIIRTKEAFFNKTNEIISYNMHAVAMDTTTKPFQNFQGTTW